MQVDQEVLSNVIEAALAAVGGDKRWENAFNRGALLIEEERCLPTADGSALIIFSTSGKEYRTTADECRTGGEPCAAFPYPCKHRAAFRLLSMVEEAEDESETSH